MKSILLCGNPKCCPSIREDTKKGIVYIIDGDQKIAFDKKQVENLTKYLNKRGG